MGQRRWVVMAGIALICLAGACSSTDLSFDAEFVDTATGSDTTTGGTDTTSDVSDMSSVADVTTVADTSDMTTVSDLADVTQTCRVLFPNNPKMELVISEVAIGGSAFIELHNPTNTDFSVTSLGGSGYRICEPSVCKTLAELNASLKISAGSYVRLSFPSAFTKAANNFGELVLYNGEVKPENVIDYICWGTGTFVSKGDGGKWAGDCVSAIPNGKSLQRISDSDGLTASSYSVSNEPSASPCQ